MSRGSLWLHATSLQKVAFWKGNPLISGKSRLVKYYDLARLFQGFFGTSLPFEEVTEFVMADYGKTLFEEAFCLVIGMAMGCGAEVLVCFVV